MEKIKPVFEAKIENGKLFFLNQKKFDEFIATKKDDKYKITVARYKKTRSDKQNRYYWGVVIKILNEECGNFEPDDDLVMHETLKRMFLDKIMSSKLINKATGELLPQERITGSTKLLTTIDMESYLAKIRAWASMELGVNIPEPNEIDYSSVW